MEMESAYAIKLLQRGFSSDAYAPLSVNLAFSKKKAMVFDRLSLEKYFHKFLVVYPNFQDFKGQLSWKDLWRMMAQLADTIRR